MHQRIQKYKPITLERRGKLRCAAVATICVLLFFGVRVYLKWRISEKTAEVIQSWQIETGLSFVLDSEGNALRARNLIHDDIRIVYVDREGWLDEISINPSGSECAVLFGDRKNVSVLIIDLHTGTLLHRVNLPDGLVTVGEGGQSGPVWSPDGNAVAVACDRKTIEGIGSDLETIDVGYTIVVIDAKTGKPLKKVTPNHPGIERAYHRKLVSWNNHGLLVSYQYDGAIQGETIVVSPESDKVIAVYSFRLLATCLTGEVLFVKDDKCYLATDLQLSKVKEVPINIRVRGISFSPDGKYLFFIAPREQLVELQSETRFYAVNTETAGIVELSLVPESMFALAKESWLPPRWGKYGEKR